MSNNRNQQLAGGQKPADSEVQQAPSSMPGLPVEKHEDPELKPNDLPPQVPAASNEEPQENSTKFEAQLAKAGIKQPNLFKEIGHKEPSPKERTEVLNKIEKKLKAGQPVYVIATKDGGDYPPRVRRSLGEKFKIKEAKHFSFNWHKLVD